MTRRPSVGVVGIGLCTPLGRDLDTFWQRIAAGRDGFAEVDRYDLSELPTRFASAFDAVTTRALCAEAGADDPAVAYAVLAGRAALADVPRAERADIGIVAATSAGAADTHDAFDSSRGRPDRSAEALGRGAFTHLAAHLADDLGLHGPRTAVSTACASGGHAIGLAADLVRSGRCRRALVVAADAVYPMLFSGFHAVGALATRPCAPFGATFGMSLGEGAGALLLAADPDDALGWVLGWGGSCDAFHPTAPDPRGEGLARALRDALDDAGVAPGAIGAYNAHGTGTEANDPAETFAVGEVLGEVPVSATKSQIGHTQGAAGALEAITVLAGLRAQAVPPTLRSQPPRRIAPPDTVGDRARPHPHDVAISASAAFGGTNVAVVLGRSPGEPHEIDPGAIVALGVGAAGVPDIARRLDPSCPAVPPATPRASARRADPISVDLTAAIAAALSDADRPTPADDVALVAGMADGPQTSIRRFVDSRDRRGLGQTSGAAFARMVFNAPAGAAAAATQVRGTNVTLWSGHGAGLHAVLVGAQLLATHARPSAVVAAGADELGFLSDDRHDLATLPAAPARGAAAVLLGRGRGLARLAGSGWGPTDAVDDVLAAALGPGVDRVIASMGRGLGLPALDAPIFDLDAAVGHAPAASGTLACAAAIDWIRAGVCRSVLVVVRSVDAGCVAVRWEADDGPR